MLDYVFKVKIDNLKPTQFNVGLDEVKAKRKKWAKMDDEDKKEFFFNFVVPVIKYNSDYYLIDHHHECYALLKEKQEKVLVHCIDDLSSLNKSEFWPFMIMSGWCYLFDNGDFGNWNDLPKTISKLTDDPYRSLAGWLRDNGGYGKTDTPFSEFKWANYMRCRVDQADYKTALKLAHNKYASVLPGYVKEK